MYSSKRSRIERAALRRFISQPIYNAAIALEHIHRRVAVFKRSEAAAVSKRSVQ